MSNTELITKDIQFKRGKKLALNARLVPTDLGIPKSGEPVYETDTKKLKIGDGQTAYVDLPYVGETDGAAVADLTSKLTTLEIANTAQDQAIASLQTTVNDTINTTQELARLIDTLDLSSYAKSSDVEATFQAVSTALNTKANASEVYTKAEANAIFMTEDQVKTTVDKVVADVTNTDTIEGLVTLVEYVHTNADGITQLIQDVETHNKDIETNASNIAANRLAIEKNTASLLALTTAVTAQKIIESDEILVSNVTGGIQLSVNEININKLTQTPEDVLILNGSTASI